MKLHTLIAAALLSATSLSAIADNSNISGSVYAGREALAVQKVQLGTIVDVRKVQIQDTGTAGQVAGYGIGGTLGAIAGSAMGKGNGKMLTGALGGALGAMGGNVAQEWINRVDGVELVISLDGNSGAVAVTQALDETTTAISVGDRVRLTGSGQHVRVSRIGGDLK